PGPPEQGHRGRHPGGPGHFAAGGLRQDCGPDHHEPELPGAADGGLQGGCQECGQHCRHLRGGWEGFIDVYGYTL
ncbi:unnamed protein product, partial [Ixodes pacificus]